MVYFTHWDDLDRAMTIRIYQIPIEDIDKKLKQYWNVENNCDHLNVLRSM